MGMHDAYPGGRDCPVPPINLLSQERVKLRTSNFVCTFIRSFTTKAQTISGKVAVGVARVYAEIFQGIHI